MKKLLSLKKLLSKKQQKEYTRIFWMAQQIEETSEVFDKDNIDPELDPIQNRLEEAAILYYLATQELHMSKAESFGRKTLKEMKKLLKNGYTFFDEDPIENEKESNK